jgi:hypothetical protein
MSKPDRICVSCGLPKWLHPIPEVPKPSQATDFVTLHPRRGQIVLPGCVGCFSTGK